MAAGVPKGLGSVEAKGKTRVFVKARPASRAEHTVLKNKLADLGITVQDFLPRI